MRQIKPLVSIIVTTRNNQSTLGACLSSITDQSYTNCELIVVDNHSTDDTLAIARQYTPNVYTKGPERSVQRNFGVEQATGVYVAIIDSDMQLSPHVVQACMERMDELTDSDCGGIIIPEESYGEGFWAQCKRLERSFYVGVDWIEAARFYPKQYYQQAGGYDKRLVSGEDWDLSRRIAAIAPLARIGEYIFHNEGRLRLRSSLQKKYYYAKQAGGYIAKQRVQSALTDQVGPLARYRLFFAHPGKLFHNPLLGLGVLYMKTAEFGLGALGYMSARLGKAPQA